MATSCKQHLERALATDGDERLKHLVAAWRAKRATELGELVARLGNELDRKRATIAGKTVDARLATWLELEKEHDDALVGWLLASPPLESTLTRHYAPRLARVAKWAPDPRLATAMLTLLEENSFTLLADLWNPVFAQLARNCNATHVPALRAQRERLGEEPFFATRIDKAIATLAKVKPPKLVAAERKLVAQLAHSTGPSEEDLLAAIWSAPTDDAPRLVYADYLQERGDPRGEFIALSLAKKLDVVGRKRMRVLYAKYRLKWFGPLEPAILEQKSFSFERGFLATCSVCVMWGMNADDVSEPRERAIRALQDHPAWSTLREVKMTAMGNRTRQPLIAHLAKLGVKVTFAK